MKQTVIVTGASSGLGFAIAKAFLARGDNVVGNARSLDKLQTAAAQLGNPDNFLLVAGDIGKAATAKDVFTQAIAAFGHVDILVNNAGIFIAKPIGDYSEGDLDQIVATNLKGFFYPSREAAAHMAPRGAGHIINITASLGIVAPKVPAVLPVLLKGGLNMATRALALELAGNGVKVNAVAPGIIDTPMHSKDPATQLFLKSLAPTASIGRPEDIAEAVLYLANSSFITGSVLAVDGGATAGNW
jgi:NAD(P)-dependent dehydrogenase (short-subunit alcohol dehydrogenase family)